MSDPGRTKFESQQYSIAQTYNDVDALLNKTRESIGKMDINFVNLSEAADNIIQLNDEINILSKSYSALEKEISKAENAGDISKLNQLKEQQEEINERLEEELSIKEKISASYGGEINGVVAYRQALNKVVQDEERRHKQKEKDLNLAAKENELILEGKHAQLGLTEDEAKKRYYSNYNSIKEAQQEEADKKAKAEFMGENGLGGKALGVGSALDSITGGRFNIEARLSESLSKVDAGLAKGLNSVVNAIGKLGQTLNDSIKNAANFLSDNYTKINADLKGTGLTFNDIQDKAAEKLGLNRFVKQTDYLSQIAKLSAEGLNFNIEERALLETIKNKSLSTFDANDAAITRLIRFLKQDVTSAQFGIEYTLRNTLNRVFGDTSYLNKLYDNVAATIQDAALAIPGRDITPFNSTVETWLAYMYESGMSEDVVSKIAQGINYLGSGNVSALASNQDLQRLLLLSMDTAGLDYAEILQQGLDVDTTNILMKSIIKYLDEIVNNTKDNLVLQNSYANLFNMSITDMKAIHDIATSDINYLADSSSAIAATYNALAEISNDTLVATQIDNMLDNAKYTYGFDIATNNGKYIAYKVSDLLVNVMQPWTGVKGTIGRVASAANLVGSIGKFAVTALGLTSVARSLFSGSLGSSESTLGDFLDMDQASYEIANAAMNGQKSKSASTSESTSRLNSVQHVTDMIGNEEDWTRDDHDVLDILKEFERTIMMSETSKGYAIAVSLEAMNNDVLRSFASIFADEDAMLKTYEGKNNIINKNLFSYIPNDDEVDNDKIKEMAGGGSTTGGASDSSDNGDVVNYDE